MKRALVVGLGIGSMYVEQLTKLGYEVTTVDADPARCANYKELEPALAGQYEIATLSTPNFTHYDMAMKIAPCTDLLLIDKPGVFFKYEWQHLLDQNPETRIAMIKNNMWRDHIPTWRSLLPITRTVRINWINKDRVPKPGSWFTNKELAGGGVERDLMPHLLSLVAAINDDFDQASMMSYHVEQRWQLSDLTGSDYGKVDPSGVYNVNDFANVELIQNGRRFSLTTDWRSNHTEDISITFELEDSSMKTYKLGLCPNNIYGIMFSDCAAAADGQTLLDYEFWEKQQQVDLWIHGIIDALSKTA